MRILLLFTLFLLTPFLTLNGADTGTYEFKEVWAYVYKGEEKLLHPELPLTDIAHFCLNLNHMGRISETLNPAVLKGKMPAGARVHLVVSAPYNWSLMYWCLNKDKETREALIEDIVQASASYHGVQIDFESVRSEDAESYCSFLKDLRLRLHGKVLSVALPARVKEFKDGYPYEKIAQIADRLMVMAYDEHYRSGAPGAIASLNWCEKVCAYAQQKVPREKLIMGLPLYGRVWQKGEVARSLKYPQTLELWKKVNTPVKREGDGTPYFEFEETVRAVAYYEDERTLEKKLSLYNTNGINAVAFWKLGQGPAALWKHVELFKP